MRSSLKALVAISAMLLSVPTFAIADEVGDGGDMQELLTRMSDMEQQLRATNDALASANARVDQQANQLGKIETAPTGALPALSNFLSQTDFSGWVSGSYFYNTNNPSSGAGGGVNGGVNSITAPFHPDSNSFQVEQVWFGMQNAATAESRAGFEVDLVWGETADVLRGADPANSNLSYLYSANVSYLAPITDAGIMITAGRFATSIGAESAKAPDNYNITRGLVYNIQPINHTGVKISATYDNGFDWMLGVANTAGYGTQNNVGAGINAGRIDATLAQQHDSDDAKTFLWRLGYKMSDTLAVGLNGLYGGDCLINTGPSCGVVGNDKDDVGIVDLVVNWDPSDKLSMYLNFDFLWANRDGRTGSPQGHPEAFGLGVAGRYAVTDNTGVSLRGEWVGFEDDYFGISCNGITPCAGFGDDQNFGQITTTLDHALTDHLTVKAEIAYVIGSGPGPDAFFADDNGNDLTDNEVLLGVEMLYQF
ncbi:MAG: outer membrane beta-barrel protein [Myxococcota bacterium]